MFAGPRNGESFLVEEALDFENGLDVLAAVQALARGALHRLKRGKFGFPEAQNESLGARQAAHFADAEQTLFGDVRRHLCRACHVSCAPYLVRIVGGFRAMSTPSEHVSYETFVGNTLPFGCAAGGASGLTLFQALGEADGRAGEIESGAETVFEKALIAEVQRLGLIRKQDEGGRRNGGLRHVKDFHFAASGRSAALQIDTCQPTIQLACGNAAPAGLGDAIDGGEQLADALAGKRRKKDDGCVRKKFKLFADQGFVFGEELRRSDRGGFAACFLLLLGVSPRGFKRQIPFVHHDDDRAAGLLGVAGDGRVMRGDADGRIRDKERDIGALEMPARHDDAQFFGDQLGLPFSADARGIEESIRLAVVFDDVSTMSRVVPGSDETIERSAPTSRLSKVDFPTFGRPMIAMLISGSRGAVSPEGNSRVIASSSSSTPKPCSAEMGKTSLPNS